MEDYYNPKDLREFKNIGEYSPEAAKKFNEFYQAVNTAGKLGEKEKALVALGVAHAIKCPYCIETYTRKCLHLGIEKEEMTEAVFVAATVSSGAVLTHSLIMKKIIKENDQK